MEIALWIAGILGVFVGILFLIGASLPKGHFVSSRAGFRQPPERLWEVLVDIDRVPAWRADVKRIERLTERNGRPVWREFWKQGTITFERAEAIPPKRLVVRIADPTLPFGGSWTYELSPSAKGSTLTITEEGEVKNPIFRVFSRFSDPRAAMDTVLRSLGKNFGEEVRPEKVA